MPDIKSALSAALLRAPAPVQQLVQTTLNEWDDEDAGTPANVNKTKGTFIMPRVTNNVMRETFNFIMNNPNLTCKMIANGMEKKGFKPSSVTSVVSQLWRDNQLIKNGLTYRTVGSKYKPMGATPSAKIKRLKKRVDELKVVAKSKGIQDLHIQPPAQETQGIDSLAATLAQDTFDPKRIVDPLTVYQARELYNELKKLFGA
jgi:hypothetical protein